MDDAPSLESEKDIAIVNDVLAGAYMLLGILAIIQVITKFKVERKLKTSVVFPAEILFLCLVRIIYFFLSLMTWSDDHTPKKGSDFVFFVDTFPEIVFVAIYLLLVASWGTTWAKARRAMPFAPYQFWAFYWGVISTIVLLALAISLIISKGFDMEYEQVLKWEASFVVALSGLSVFAAGIFGYKLYTMLRDSATKSSYLAHVMRQLLFLVGLTTASFALKGVCVYSISFSARNEWLYHDWSTFKFGALWVSYYAVTELVPFFVVWVVLQRKETSDKVRYSVVSNVSKSKRGSEMFDSRRASEINTDTDSWRASSQPWDSRRASEISNSSDSWRASEILNSSDSWRVSGMSSSSDGRSVATPSNSWRGTPERMTKVEIPKQGTKFVVLSEEEQYDYQDARALDT